MTEDRFDYFAIDNLPKFENAFVGVLPAGITSSDDLLLKVDEVLGGFRMKK